MFFFDSRLSGCGNGESGATGGKAYSSFRVRIWMRVATIQNPIVMLWSVRRCDTARFYASESETPWRADTADQSIRLP